MLERIVKALPAYSTHNGEKNIGAVRFFFAVKGPKGGISFTMSTAWYMPSEQQSAFDLFTKGYPFDACEELMQPKGWDISYHAKEQIEEYLTATEDCEVTGGKCYCDGSSLWADDWAKGFVAGGTDWLWTKLEAYYMNKFENGPEFNLEQLS